MLSVSHLSGFGGGGPGKATVAFTASAVDTVGRNTYTFNTQAIGAAASNRKIVIGTSGHGDTAVARSVSTLTVGGVSGALVVRVSNSVEDHYVTEMWQAVVPTGTTGDVAVAWNAGMLNCGIGVFRVISATSGPSATYAVAAGDPLVKLVDVLANGILIGTAGANNTSTFAWTNLTEAYDAIVETTDSHTGAADEFASLQSSLSITCDPAGAGDRNRLVMAAWGPA